LYNSTFTACELPQEVLVEKITWVADQIVFSDQAHSLITKDHFSRNDFTRTPVATKMNAMRTSVDLSQRYVHRRFVNLCPDGTTSEAVTALVLHESDQENPSSQLSHLHLHLQTLQDQCQTLLVKQHMPRPAPVTCACGLCNTYDHKPTPANLGQVRRLVPSIDAGPGNRWQIGSIIIFDLDKVLHAPTVNIPAHRLANTCTQES
jgi:hypothetical protein